MRTITLTLLAIALIATASQAASFTYSEDFESASVGDTLPTGWTEVSGDFDVTQPSWLGGTKAVELMAAGDSEEALYTGQSNEGIDASDWQDYNITARLSTGNWSDTTTLWWGMGVRKQADGSMLGFRIRGGYTYGAAISIIRFTDTGGIGTLATSPSTSNINSDTYVDVVFNVVNDDANSEIDIYAEFTTEIASTTRSVSTSVPYGTTGAIDTPGAFALITNDAGARDFTWDDINITGNAIPEPATLGLLGIGGLALLRRRRK